jgi:lipopolysaccharide transport system ATP-binding protein
MSQIAISAERLAKQYEIGAAKRRHSRLGERWAAGVTSLLRLGGRRRKAHPDENTVWALKDVSFEVNRGDVVGIIGRNGAGKSTLLKILSRITEPTKGQVEIHGRVASLLEVGTGFHRELTGRENIYLNGAILGMSKAETERKFDEIVSFAAVDKFVDTPVKHYSSGMYVRLAFAVAAHLEPEILIVDEVLAVGDAGFQKKCLGKMAGVAEAGRTILFVSHNMAAIEHLCGKGLVLDDGQILFRGTAKEAVDHYVRTFAGDDESGQRHVVDLSVARRRPNNNQARLTRLELFTGGDQPLNGGLKVGAPLKACISFNLEHPTSQFSAVLGFDNDRGQRIVVASSEFEPHRWDEALVGDQTLVCSIPSVTLVPGEYRIKVILDIAGATVDAVEDALRLTVLESDYYGTGKSAWSGCVVLPQHWQLK